MAASSIHYIFRVSRDHIDERTKTSKKLFNLGNPLEKTFANSRSIDGSNPFILRVDRECVERIHRAYTVAMALPEIDGRWAGDWRIDFGRRGPWGRPLAQ